MKRSVLIWIIAILLVAAAGYLVFFNNTGKSDEDGIGFKLQDLNGKEWSVKELKGKRIFLNFWTTWCGYCKVEMPDLERIYQETKDTDLVILAVNVAESKQLVKSFVDNNKYSFTVLLDTGGEVSKQYNISGLPTSIFINSDGTIAEVWPGYMKYEQMLEYINNLK